MKEYAEDDDDIGTTMASVDERFENDLGSKWQPLAQVFGLSPIHGELVSIMPCIHPQ